MSIGPNSPTVLQVIVSLSREGCSRLKAAWAAVALSAMALTLLSPGTSHAQSATPSVRIGTAVLLSPTTADGWYGSSTTSTNGLGLSTRPPEIIELARALSNDPDKIYDYVRNNIEITWIYGLQKGGLGAITDEAGTAFDQANLMVELLRQAGFTAGYRAGTITLTGAQFADWSGISDAKAACQLLSSGGIPAVINGSTSAGCDYSGSVSTIQLGHIWVSVVIGGTTYVFDPAYKGHVFKAGVNLAAAAGLTSGQPLAEASSGMETGTDSTVGYVRNLNTEALETKLSSMASNLQTYIETNAPAGQIEDLISGQDIARYDPPSGGLRQASLPYTSAVQRTWSGGIPDQYRTTLQVQLTKAQPDASFPTIIDKTLYIDEVASRKLTMDPTFASRGGNAFTMAFSAVGEAGYSVPIQSWSAPTSPLGGGNPKLSYGVLTLTVNPPYAAAANGGGSPDGTYMNAVVAKSVDFPVPFTILNGWGDIGPKLVEKWGAPQDRTIPPAIYPACETCVGGFVSTAGDSRRAQMAANWLTQSSRAARIQAAIGRSVLAHHWSIGVVAADTNITTTNTNPPGTPANNFYSIVDSFDRVDVDTAFSLTSKTADAIARRAGLHAIASTLETTEGGVAAQISDLPDTNSTANRFAWGNRPPSAEDPSGGYGPRRFFGFNSSNSSYALGLARTEGQITSSAGPSHGGGEPVISGSEVLGRRTQLANAISSYAAAGYSIVSSEEAFLGPGQRAGAYYDVGGGLATNGASGFYHFDSQQRGGALVATRYQGDDPVEIAHVIVGPDGLAKGGGGGSQLFHQAQYDPSKSADVLKSRFVDRSTAVGVDLAAGNVTYSSPATLTVGAGDFPYSLSANVIWRGGEVVSVLTGPTIHTQPQVPWTTNWNNTLNVSGSAMEAMGATDVRATAGTIAAFLAIQDIYKAAPSNQREAAAQISSAWWARQLTGNVVTATIGADSRQFIRRHDGQWFAPGAGSYATLTQTGSRVVVAEPPPCNNSSITFATTRGWDYPSMTYQVTNANGDVQTFSSWWTTVSDGIVSCVKVKGFRLTGWTFPQGVSLGFVYDADPAGTPRLAEVNNSLGRRIVFTKVSNSDYTFTGFNNGLSGADLRSVSVTPTYSPTSVQTTHTDPTGAQTKFDLSIVGSDWRLNRVYTANNLTTAALQYDYDSLGRAKEVRDANALQLGSRGPYQFLIGNRVRGERIDPAGGRYSVLYDVDHRPFRFIDEIGRTTTAAYDGRGRMTGYTYPEGDRELLAYDGRNNVVEMRRQAKPGSGLSDLVIGATWNATWNKPATITDARGNTTTFAYFNSGAGTSLMSSATRPDPDGGGPMTAPVYSFTYNSLGQPLTATDPTGLVTANTYNAANYPATSVLNPSGINAITSFSYDAQGDVVSVDGPRTDVVDVTYATYDAMRRKRFEIGADPDAGGAQQRQMSRTTYDGEGRAIQVDAGRGNSTTGSDFVVLQTATTAYDPVGNKLKETTPAGVSQFTYDAANRQTCAAIRMNPGVYGSLPASACSLGTAGTFGADRITASTYDLAGQLLNTVEASGTPVQRTYATYTYSPNGQQVTVKDARDNLSTMEFDGFDRLVKLRYPMPTSGAGTSSTTDYEAYTWDANGNRTSVRRRDGAVIGYTFDTLNRETVKDIPGGTAADVYTAYDGAGRITSLLFASTGGSGIVLGYDSAKRMNSEATFGQAMSYQYDLANNRTRVTWPDAFYAQYAYDAANRLTTVGENGATSGVGLLASFTYDALGRRTGLTRGNGTSTTYAYDDADRPTSLTQDLSGTAWDYGQTFTWSPASQIVGRTVSNTAYDWAAPTPGTTTRAYDGLNRFTSWPAATYDARGNLTGDGTRTFVYDVENRLTSVGGPVSLTISYDPVGRIRQTSAPAVPIFLYDGERLSAEYDAAGVIQRRYVHGVGVDEPLVWYMGSGTTDRRFLHHDRQGSVIAWSDGSGATNASQIYSYGPWGEPGDNWATGGSRFRYTGQIAFPALQLYYYKARFYDPVLGRFLQTDPVGYDAGLNLYGYVDGDPLNATDPSGTQSFIERVGAVIQDARNTLFGETAQQVHDRGGNQEQLSEAIRDDGVRDLAGKSIIGATAILSAAVATPVAAGVMADVGATGTAATVAGGNSGATVSTAPAATVAQAGVRGPVTVVGGPQRNVIVGARAGAPTNRTADLANSARNGGAPPVARPGGAPTPVRQTPQRGISEVARQTLKVLSEISEYFSPW